MIITYSLDLEDVVIKDVKIGDMAFNGSIDCSREEARELWNMQKETLEKLPEILEKVNKVNSSREE